MTSFMIIEVAALVAPVGALLLVPWLAPERRRRLVAWSALWLVSFTVAGVLGLRLTPPPLAASGIALAVAAGWVIAFALRPDEDQRLTRRLYVLLIGGAFVVNYLAATMTLLGFGSGAEDGEPEVRERLTPTIVAYAFRVGGAELDTSGYDVEVRRSLPWFGYIERVESERSYVTMDAARLAPPSFRLEGEVGVRGVLVTLGDWAEGLYPSPDTILLD